MNASAQGDAPYLEFCDVTKEFPGVHALKGVSFGVRRGSVLALLGENGAGKSTLLKTLSGAHRPTSGTLKIGGRDHVFENTSEAIAAGVAVIYQELHLVPEMSVAENIFIGHLPTRRGLIDRATLHQEAAKLLKQLGEEIDPALPLKKLPIGQRQMVEIAKALSRGAQVIAFDEPTSSLSAREIEKLFAVIRDLRAQGCAILYVTHRMEEVFRLCVEPVLVTLLRYHAGLIHRDLLKITIVNLGHVRKSWAKSRSLSAAPEGAAQIWPRPEAKTPASSTRR